MGDPAKVIFRREFLKRWLMGLQACKSHKAMTFWERKRAIKLSADMAMASTPTPTPTDTRNNWRRALIARAYKDDNKHKPILPHVFQNTGWIRPSHAMTLGTKILRRSAVRRMRTRFNRTMKKKEAEQSGRRRLIRKDDTLKRLVVKKRTQVLRRLVPGGEDIADDGSLMEETLDYLVSLRAQVDVMRQFAAQAAHLLQRK